MYTRRLKLLLRALRISGQSGVVSIEPLQQDAEEPWIAHLQLLKGEVGSCQVRRKRDGQVLLNDAVAMQWLENEEQLSWKLEESSQATLPSLSYVTLPTGNPPFPHTEHTIPRPAHQLRQIIQEEVFLPPRSVSIPQNGPAVMLVPKRTGEHTTATASWPREYRQIFALVDGHRTSTQIALLLHWAPEHVVQVLRDLQARGLIEL